MTTRLTDVIIPEVFYPYMMKRTKEKSAIFQSGIMRPDDSMSAFLGGGGRTVNVPFWKDLDNTESGVANDNPGSTATPGKIDSGKDIAARQIRTRGWAAAKLSAELAGDDPMSRIAERVSDYWVRQYQRILVSTLTGVFADNVANDSNDMVNDIGTDDAGAAVAAELVGADAILDTAQTMGDASDDLDTLIMHSVVYTRLAKLNLIDFIPDARGEVNFPTYLGYRVIKDDGVYAEAGDNRTKYWTYLVGRGAMAWADVPVATPVEVDRLPAQGNGMGVDQLWTRQQYIMHPYGIAWQDSSVAGEFPTNAELEAAANWDRVYAERKQIPISALVTNG